MADFDALTPKQKKEAELSFKLMMLEVINDLEVVKWVKSRSKETKSL